jgi:hypothetical protein
LSVYSLSRPESRVSSAAMPRLLRPTEVADMLGVTVGWLANLRHQQRGIPFVKLETKAIRYRAEDVEAYLAASVVEPVKVA